MGERGGRVSSSGDDRLTERLAAVPDSTAELFSGSLTSDPTTPPWLAPDSSPASSEPEPPPEALPDAALPDTEFIPAPVPLAAQLLQGPQPQDPGWRRKAERTARKSAGRTQVGPPRRLSITLVIAAVAVGIAFLAQLVGGRTTGATDQPVTAVHGDSIDLTRPFATTPAADWTNGAAGIVPPAAQPVGGYSAAQVAAAYTQVRQVLIAAHLATTTLIDHDLTGYLNLLAPSVRPHLKAALTGAGLGRDGGEITMIENGFTLLPVPVKVSGSMNASVSSTGALVVHTNYVFAYPFAPPNSASITSAWQVVAVAHVIEDFTVATGANYAVADQGLWPGSSVGYYSSMACGPAALGYLAPEYSQPYTGPTATVDPDQDYSLDRPSQTATTC